MGINQSASTSSLPGTIEWTSPNQDLESCSNPEQQHQLDIRAGFLPRTPPLTRIDIEPWCEWERALDKAKGLQTGFGEALNSHSATWRYYIREQLPILTIKTTLSQNLILLRRAHLVLAFLVHFYVHSDEIQETLDHVALVPSSLALPLCAISQLLDIPPVLTYSDTVLYNWNLLDPAIGFTPNNIKILTTFTGTTDEEHFYKTSVLIESLGPMCLSLIRSSLDEALLADQLSVARISSNLIVLSTMIEQITLVLESVREGCEPFKFYWLIRPWMNGGKRKMGNDDDEKVINWGGPSAGQSTLIHTLDIFLGIDHRPREGKNQDLLHEDTFMQRMSNYMPYHHRSFLNHLNLTLSPDSQSTVFPQLPNHPNHSIRSLAIGAHPDSDLFKAYNQSVKALLKMRSTHSRIALLYVLSQSRVSPPSNSAFLTSWERSREIKKKNNSIGELGTGGTDLARFLKRCRERTSEAIIVPSENV